MSNAYEIAKKYVGQYVDNDGAFGAQCVDIIQVVAQEFGATAPGNGNQIGTMGTITEKADIIPYREGMELITGDILPYDVPSHGYGHVVIYGSGDIRSMQLIEQNFSSSPVIEHTRGLESAPLRVVRFRDQSNYKPDGGGSSGDKTKKEGKKGTLYKITCDIVEGIKGNGDNTVVDIFYKCNTVVGNQNGEWIIYYKNDNTVAYLPASCVEKTSSDEDNTTKSTDYVAINAYNTFSETTSDGLKQDPQRVISLGEFIKEGQVSYGNFSWKYMVKANLPDKGKSVKGLITNAQGFVSDGQGNIVLGYPKSFGNVRGKLYKTPFGKMGKAYYEFNDIDHFVVFIR